MLSAIRPSPLVCRDQVGISRGTTAFKYVHCARVGSQINSRFTRSLIGQLIRDTRVFEWYVVCVMQPRRRRERPG